MLYFPDFFFKIIFTLFFFFGLQMHIGKKKKKKNLL